MKHPRYKIVQPLGQGQGGQTLLARTPEGTLAVIKHIDGLGEPLDVLTHRLRAVGQHPQLPALLDSWQTSGGQCFAFEHVSAPPLTTAIPPPWSPTTVESWLLAVLPVLEHLHSFRLVHGDIRPANIRHGRPPSLVDIRITQRLDKQAPALAASSGDAAYGAPEQALGRLVYASDLYSLGLVAIHLLTGFTPFELYSVAENRWIWPDVTAESVSPNLAQVLPRLLERSPDTRYTSAAAILADLKKSPALSLINKALALFPSPSSPPAIKKSALPPVPQISWRRLHRFTTGITSALALQDNILAMGTGTGAILVCDLAAGAEIYSLETYHRDLITALAFHPRHTLYSACSDGTVGLWDLADGTLKNTLSQPGWQPTDLAVSEAFLIVSDGSGYITLWDRQQLTPCHSFNQHQDWVTAVAARGDRLASISCDRTLRLWSLSKKRLMQTVNIGPSRGLALHPSGNYAIIGDDRGRVDVWSFAPPAQAERLCSNLDGITALALSPDARLLAVGTEGNTLQVREGASGQCVSELTQGWGVIALAFDGSTLASSSQDETVTVWRRTSG